MFKGPQGMSLTGNAAAAFATVATVSAAAAAATSAATAVADKTKMCASSLIFRANKWCFSLASGGLSHPNPPPRKNKLP